eukprot:Protomagalhaensia_wolfi_Nauph_80__3120@NODE_318_length_2797_cov_12_520667_g240_i0_p4_GENE_NODE_318_length_2797_cov_12_520667_g240_i0NODE_318_length_2797_cov_12_520667_g240_i0_p4_ORF_typecomplete_len112_score16_04LppLpqN/PF10738_9/0_071_NODE_318_length_2797_cov_12_520667_g240_i07221057
MSNLTKKERFQQNLELTLPHGQPWRVYAPLNLRRPQRVRRQSGLLDKDEAYKAMVGVVALTSIASAAGVVAYINTSYDTWRIPDTDFFPHPDQGGRFSSRQTLQQSQRCYR